ncbi:Uncharacterised protein [Streptococcus suis]|uniref:Uncharacterized protein n=1 Tax=Streptococcus suis TaxID=1307 RepID=A0A0Z8IRH2_STRSU|nr:Uncharacterised protein [Streptococcus suis]
MHDFPIGLARTLRNGAVPELSLNKSCEISHFYKERQSEVTIIEKDDKLKLLPFTVGVGVKLTIFAYFGNAIQSVSDRKMDTSCVKE